MGAKRWPRIGSPGARMSAPHLEHVFGGPAHRNRTRHEPPVVCRNVTSIGEAPPVATAPKCVRGPAGVASRVSLRSAALPRRPRSVVGAVPSGRTCCSLRTPSKVAPRILGQAPMVVKRCWWWERRTPSRRAAMYRPIHVRPRRGSPVFGRYSWRFVRGEPCVDLRSVRRPWPLPVVKR
jgi:hypothetical protein